jgi:gamma-polyglutamate synthase
MQSAVADPGAFNIEYIKFNNFTIAWANLFAVNDRESFIEICLKLFKQLASYQRIVLLNNRHDRPTRVELFAGMALDLQFDRVITLGDYESAVGKVFSLNQDKIIHLGNSTKFKNVPATELLAQIVSGIDENKILLVGAVNIHTIQAEKLLHFLEEQLNAETVLAK